MNITHTFVARTGDPDVAVRNALDEVRAKVTRPQDVELIEATVEWFHLADDSRGWHVNLKATIK